MDFCRLQILKTVCAFNAFLNIKFTCSFAVSIMSAISDLFISCLREHRKAVNSNVFSSMYGQLLMKNQSNCS